MFANINRIRLSLIFNIHARRLIHSTGNIQYPRNVARRRVPTGHSLTAESSRPASQLQPGSSKNADVAATLASHSSVVREDPNASWFMDRERAVLSEPNILSASDAASLPSQRSGDGGGGSISEELDGMVQHLIKELKARNVAVIDMRNKCQWTEWMIISEGVSEAHVKRMTRQFYQMLKDRQKTKTGGGGGSGSGDGKLLVELMDGSKQPLAIEGNDSPDWKLIDLGRYIFHFFTPDARQLYNLEELWSGVTNAEDNRHGEDKPL